MSHVILTVWTAALHLCQIVNYFTMLSTFFDFWFLFQLLNTCFDGATLLLNYGKQLWNDWRHNTNELWMNKWQNEMAVWSWHSIHPSCQDFFNLKSHMLWVNVGTWLQVFIAFMNKCTTSLKELYSMPHNLVFCYPPVNNPWIQWFIVYHLVNVYPEHKWERNLIIPRP